jgi:hypothetical protein
MYTHKNPVAQWKHYIFVAAVFGKLCVPNIRSLADRLWVATLKTSSKRFKPCLAHRLIFSPGPVTLIEQAVSSAAFAKYVIPRLVAGSTEKACTPNREKTLSIP